MKNKLLMLLVIVALLLFPAYAFCAPNNLNWGNTDTIPLLQRAVPYDFMQFGGARGGASQMASTSTAVPTDYAVAKKYISTTVGQAGTLANGVSGQVLMILITNRDASGTFVLTPTTKTGFTSITFDAVNDCVTLLFVNSTIGWVIIGYNSVTIS